MSASVPRLRLCSSLFVVEHSSYNSDVNAECATNEVAQFIVCCATFDLSVALLFFNAELFFSQAMSLSTPCEKFQFLAIISKVKILKNHKFWRTCGSPYGYAEDLVCGCMGVSGVFFSSYSFAFPRINHTRHNAIHVGHRMP